MKDAVTEECCEECTDHKDDVMSTENHEQSQKNQSRILEQEIGFGTEGEQFAFSIHSQTKLHLDENQENLSHLKVPFSNSMWVTEENVIPDMTEKPSEDLRLEGFDCECQSVSCYNQVSKDESSTSIIGSLAQSFFEQNNMGTDGGHLECAEVEGNGTCFSTDVQHCNIEANTSARPSLSKSHHEKKNIAIAARHPECTEFEGNGTCFSADEQRCSIEANTSASPSLAKSHHQKKDIAIIEGHVEFAEVEGNGTCLSVDVQHYNIGVNTFEEEISFEREFFPSASPAELQFKQDACSLHLKEISFNAQDIEDAEKKSTLSSRCNDSNHEIETVPDHNVETEHTSAFPSLTKSYFEKKDIAIVKGHVECVEIEGNGTCLSIDVPHCNIDPNILEQEHSDTKQKDDVLSNCNKFPFSNPIHGTGDYAIEGVEGNATHYSRLDDYNHMDQHIGDCNHINSYKYLGSLAPQHICDYFNSSSHSPPCSLQNEQNVRISLCCHDSPIAQEEKSAFSEAEAERIISKPGLASSSIEIPNIDYAVHNSTEMPNLEYDISVKNDEYETRTERQHSFKSLSSRKSFECCKLGGLTFSEAEEVGSPAQTLHSTNPRISTQVTSATPITSISRIAASSAAISVRLTPEMKDTENCRYQQEVEMTFGQDAKNEVLYPTCRAPQRSSGHNDLACMSPSKEKQKLSIDLSSCTQDVEKIESLEVESINGGNENQMDCSELPLLDQSLKGNTAENDDGNIENEMDCTESPGQPHCLNGNNSGDDNNDKETSMDCEESPDLPHSLKEINAKEWKVQETERIIDCKSTPECDEGVLKFNQLLALGTVNSSRRKRPRSPTICTEESCKDFKRIKLFSAEKSCHFDREELPDAVFLRSPAFRSNSSMYGIPYFSPIRRFQNTFDKNFEDISGKTFEMEGFDNFQEQLMDSKQLPKSSMQLPYLQKDYVDTPRMNSANIGFIGRAANKQLLDCNLITQIEEDEKENQCPKTLTRGRSYRNTSMQSDIHTSANSRKALSHVNHSLGQVESPHRRYNLATGTGSFLSFVQQKQQASFPYPSGKREVKVKALEAAEFARKQEEKRENERRMRRLENNDAKGMDSDSVKEKLQNNTAPVALKGVTEKVKKVADLKMKMDQEKARKQEMEQKKKEDERKKKEAELANKKRKREEAERRDREEKRKRVEEAQRMRKEQEERQRIELEEKELKRKMQEERERERKAHEDEAKKQRRLEKEKEAERRRKQDQDLKVAKYMEKQAERKRKEAMTRTQGNEDDDFIIQTTKEKKLSHISTDSLAVSISADWGTQFESKIRTRSQTSEVSCGFQMPSHSTPVYNSDKLTSVLESELFLSAQPVVSEGSSTANMIIGSYAQLIHPDDEIKSYEISPYKSSSDDDEDDDEPKKPVPLWARKENLLQQLAWQQDIDPDQIFSSEKTCNLSQIFGTTGSRRCYNFTQRSTSGDWFEDHATWKEQVDYKKAMGYM
ncbi:hypothetical protein KP509_06G034000 [Ceratopteris richardii]|nr:hypothetical protein KP509_06G034000 [Ceratopteris richardii]